MRLSSSLFRRLFRVFLVLTIIFGLCFVGFVAYVDRQIERRDFSNSYSDCHKVWTARGIYGGAIEQNSIESIGKAFEQGAMGVEVDVFYDVAFNDFVVSHDYPYNNKQGQLLKLSALFNRYPQRHYYWLDLKKQSRLSTEQIEDAVQRLQEISVGQGLAQRIYVESESPGKLSQFKRGGFNTLFDTRSRPASSWLAPIMMSVYKIAFYLGDYTVMGMEYGDIDDPIYGPSTRHRLGSIPVFLYHLPVNDALIDSMLEIDSVKAFIVGNNQSVNYHYKNSCINKAS